MAELRWDRYIWRHLKKLEIKNKAMSKNFDMVFLILSKQIDRHFCRVKAK